MLKALIDFHLNNRWVVFLGLVAVAGYGFYSLSNLPIEAFPDLTNNQVVVVTECPAMGPAEVEMLVTYPIETAMMGLPKMEEVRSISKLGLSMVTVIFDDSVNTYFARQVMNERLNEVRNRLPAAVKPTLGPVATAFGEVYQYTVEGPQSAMDLKALHDWQIRNQLRSLQGVNEINTWGGLTRQYQVEVNPSALLRYGLTLRDVFERLRENNENFGGGYIEHGSEQYNVRGLGRAAGIEDLRKIVVLSRAGTPVLLREVANVKLGPMPRQGAVTRDGRGEAVSGMVIMLKGENGKNVIERVKARLASLHLPDGVKIRPFYDQSEVIDGTIATVRRNLLEGGLLVMVVLFVFLGNVRAAVLVALVIPLSMLVGFIGMRLFGVSANLMSLGAIDFGMIVDGAVVMMENTMRRLHQRDADGSYAPFARVEAAAREVGRPILFGVAIIIAVYLPIFLLEGLEGRMFRPMAVTVCSALLKRFGHGFDQLCFGAESLPLRARLKEHIDIALMDAHRLGSQIGPANLGDDTDKFRELLQQQAFHLCRQRHRLCDRDAGELAAFNENGPLVQFWHELGAHLGQQHTGRHQRAERYGDRQQALPHHGRQQPAIPQPQPFKPALGKLTGRPARKRHGRS